MASQITAGQVSASPRTVEPQAVPAVEAVDATARAHRWRPARVALVAFVVVIGLNVLAVALQSYFLRLNLYGFQYSTERIVNYYDAPRPDVVFMGTSRALNGFDPSVIEDEVARRTGRSIRALNLGIAGGTIDVHYLVLKNIISDDKKPSVLVYGITEYELLSAARAGAAGNRYSAILLRPDDFFTPYVGPTNAAKLEFIINQLCPLCRDRELIRDGLHMAFDPDYPGHAFFAEGQYHRDPAPNGYHAAEAGTHEPRERIELFKQQNRPGLQHYRFGDEAVSILQDFLALARARGITVLLVNLPVTDELLSLWGPEELEAYSTGLRAMASSAGVPLLDLYRTGKDVIPAEGFLDPQHLNKGGAAVFSRLVADEALADLLAASPR